MMHQRSGRSLAEVEAAFDALRAGAARQRQRDAARRMFLDAPTTVRYGVAEVQHGYRRDRALSARSQAPFDAQARRDSTITTYGSDCATASTLFHRPDLPGQIGRQMQTWVRTPDGWRVAAAHVSMMRRAGLRPAGRRACSSAPRRRKSGARLPRASSPAQLAPGTRARRDPARRRFRRVAHAGARGPAAARRQRAGRPEAARQGASSPSPTRPSCAGMFEVMGYLEALCAGLAALAMTARARRARRPARRDGGDRPRRRRGALCRGQRRCSTAAIYDGAHNAYLGEITRATRQRLQPFRRAQFGALGRLGKSHAEHGLIVEAILRGDAPAPRPRCASTSPSSKAPMASLTHA